jgi:hypothetical protein
MTPHKLALATVAALALAVPALALAGGQPGQTVNIDTQVKLRNGAPAFHGKVTAGNPNCVEDRLVKMFQRLPDGSKKLLGKTHAANNGKWKIPFQNITSAEYYAVAKKVEQGTAGTIYVCLKAKSESIVVD